VRVLLDAQLSAPRIGEPLAALGHEVRAIVQEPDLDGFDDESVLELATGENRILVTCNSRDFAPLCRSWAESGREHAGVILIWSLSSNQFSDIVAAVDRCLSLASGERDWRGVVRAV
jgi:predicted nuclease of predicted toxin-antitoxin system